MSPRRRQGVSSGGLSACTPTLTAPAGAFAGPWTEKSTCAANLSHFPLTGTEETLGAQPDLDSTPALVVNPEHGR